MTRSPQWNARVAKARAVDIASVVAARGGLGLKKQKKELIGPCPQCGGEDRFAVFFTKSGKQIFHCRACGAKGDAIALIQFLDGCDFDHAIEKLTGEAKPAAPKSKPNGGGAKLGAIVAEYNYADAHGSVLFQVVRYDDPKKDFRQRRPDGNSGWIWGTDGVQLVPYRLPQVLEAVKQQQVVFVLEGEKDVVTAEGFGLVATTSPGGVGMGWRDEYDQHFAGADVVVVPDSDAQGRNHAANIANHLLKVARRARMLTLPAKDLTEFAEAGGTREQFDALLADAPDYQEVQGPPAETVSEANGDVDAELERLAKLPPFDYERARKAAAEQLDVRAAVLDRLVQAKRAELGLKDDGGLQGHAIAFPEPEPWPDPVAGDQLLSAVAAAIRQHVVFDDHARDLAALWVVHTFLLDAFLITPRLAVRSPVRRCGKTTLLDILTRLVCRPLPAANTSAAAIYRVIEGYQPTLLIDEFDSFSFGDKGEELRNVLNSGHRRGGSVLRTVGEDHEPRSFATYGACVIALIGNLPGTLTDRAVTIDLKRRLASEPIEPFRLDRTEHLDVLARQIARWAKDHAEAVRVADPAMPKGVFNRDADNLRPLLAIADVASGKWPERARQAASQGLTMEADEGSRLELLLADIRDIFAASDHADQIASADLITRLVEIDGRPWAEYGRSGKPITQAKLARLLAPLGIAPTRARLDAGSNLRAYGRWQFADAFDRFLSPQGGSKAEQWNEPDEMGTSDLFQSGTAENDVPLSKREKSNNDGLCSTVPLSEVGQNNSPRAGGSVGRAVVSIGRAGIAGAGAVGLRSQNWRGCERNSRLTSTGTCAIIRWRLRSSPPRTN